MKLFVWKKVHHLTDRYHCRAGLLVFSESLAEAMDTVQSTRPQLHSSCEGCGTQIDADERLLSAPDLSLTLKEDHPPGVMYFLDAGCC